MGRPSLKTERKAQILAAFERCIARYGVEGAGLQKVADEAGLARPLIRHHVGNRDALLLEVTEEFIRRSDASLAELAVELPDSGRMAALLVFLFSRDYQPSDHATLLYQALATASQTRPALRTRLQRWNDDFLAWLVQQLRADYPDADDDALPEVAVGIAALYFNADSMALLGAADELLARSHCAASRLVQSLGDAAAGRVEAG